jgi:hypothetical protein
MLHANQGLALPMRLYLVAGLEKERRHEKLLEVRVNAPLA